MYDVAIVGAGVVGGLIARELSRYRLSVCLLEAQEDVAMGATRANSAIVHAGFDAKEGSLKARLNVQGAQMMEQLCRELGVKYRRNGSLVVGFDEEDRQTLEQLRVRGEKNGVEGLALLSREQALALEPALGDGVCCALYAPSGAIVCPYELCMAAVGNAMDNGAELLLDFRVCALREQEEGYTVVAADGREVEARYVVNCAGVFSADIARLAGDDSFTVHPRRGEYLLLDRDCGSLIMHTVFRCPTRLGKGILVSPTVDGNLLLGPTAEDITDPTDTATTARGLAAVRQAAGEQVRGIALGRVITSFTGLRSVGSTSDFVIGMPRPRFLNCAAIESPGLSSSPAIATYAVALLAEAGLPLLRRESFRATRPALHAFREMDVEEKNQVIARDPSYAHIVCRCETVSEGEILAAIRQNPRPRDVDGVKRRTRATMGRCQGGFCTPAIVELLAREWGVDPLRVTKFGGGSYMNLGRTKGAEGKGE